MPTLNEVREKYPEYKDMPDDKLADALHSKFYSDMPKEEFEKKIGQVKEEPVDPRSRWERFKTGFMDPVYGAAQLAARSALPEMPGPEDFEAQKSSTKKIDEVVKTREEGIEKSRGGDTSTDWWRVGGKAANPLPYAGAALGGLPGAAAAGLISGLVEPVAGENYEETKLRDGLFGTAFGFLGGAATKAIGSGIAPTVREQAAELMKRGIQLTPGQIAGGIARRAEEAAKSIPGLGSFIRNAEGRSIESFNTSAVNAALDPIGEKLPSVVQPGRDAIGYAQARLSAAYDNLLPKMKLSLDQDFASDMALIAQDSLSMPKAQQKQLANIIQNKLSNPLRAQSSMSGEELKTLESELTNFATRYQGSSVAGEQHLGSIINDIRGVVRDALARQNPAEAETLKKINSGYAIFARLQGAANRSPSKLGVFSPQDLLQSVKNADKSVRKGAFARGDALMQDFAEYASHVLPSKMPDSGTPERAIWAMLMGGGATIHPLAAAGAAAATLPYTKLGGQAVQAASQPGPVRQAVGQGIKKMAPVGGTVAEDVLHQLGAQ